MCIRDSICVIYIILHVLFHIAVKLRHTAILTDFTKCVVCHRLLGRGHPILDEHRHLPTSLNFCGTINVLFVDLSSCPPEDGSLSGNGNDCVV